MMFTPQGNFCQVNPEFYNNISEGYYHIFDIFFIVFFYSIKIYQQIMVDINYI